MPQWSGGSSASTGSVEFKPTPGGQGPSSHVYHATASGGGSGVAGEVANKELGVMTLNPLDPKKSIVDSGAGLTDLLDGLKSGLFGTSLPDAQGKHGGIIGDVPGLGDVARAASETVSNAAGGALSVVHDLPGHAADAIGGTLERVGNPLSVLDGEGERSLDNRFNAPEVQTWLDEANREDPEKTNREVYYSGHDEGIGGTGFLSNEPHAKNTVLRKYALDQVYKNPTLNAGKFEAAGSLADLVTNIFADPFSAAGEYFWRGVTGVKGVEERRAIGAGEAVSTGFLGTGLFAGSKEATPGEQLVAAKMASGEWTEDQALDFLMATGQSSHDAGLSIAAAVLDPLTVASFGAAGIASLGAKGASLVKAVSAGDKIVTEASVVLKAAQEAAAFAKAARQGSKARAGLRAANKAVKAAEGSLAEVTAARDALTAARTARATYAVGKQYAALGDSMTGRVAKATRTLIDPLHAIDLHLPGNTRMLDMASDVTTRTLRQTLGPLHYDRTFASFQRLETTGVQMDQFARDLATASANRLREGLLKMHQDQSILKGTGGKLADDPGLREKAIAESAGKTRESSAKKFLREDYSRNVIQQNWDDKRHLDLAMALEARYHIPKEVWLDEFKTMTKEQKSLLDFAQYGGATTALDAALSTAKATGHEMVTKWDPDKFILIAKDTLTRIGGESLLADLKKLPTREAIRRIRQAQEEYPELLYIPIDDRNKGRSVEKMIAYLEDRVEGLPMQFTNDELASMHDDVSGLTTQLGDRYSLGMRPKDEFLWGIERSNEKGGGYIAKRVPWADHVSEGGLGYRPGHKLPLNIAGMPIIGKPLRVAEKAVDYMEAGSTMLLAQVSGAQVQEMARQRFVSQASRGRFAEYGLTENVANKWFERLHAYTKEHQGYSGPRGFGKGDLYTAIEKEKLIPQTLLNGAYRIEPEDILRMVLEAYDGDMRIIGLTQKLSARAKTVLSASTGFHTNYAGQIAEHAWPTMKFRYNPIFQMQEKIEPVILNAQRGISFAKSGTDMNAADRVTERLLQRMTDQSIIRQADLDMFEQSMYALFGKRMENLAKTPGGKMARVQGAAASFMDVQGMKRINMVRTFRSGLGKEFRQVWEETQPGVWDDMLAHQRAVSGRMIDEDEFAVQMMAENLLGNDIPVTKMTDNGVDILKADWANAIKTSEWYKPSHMGQMVGLDIGHIAKTMNIVGDDGKRIDGLADLRAYLAADKSRMKEVTEYLNRMGAHPDYVARVENSLKFSWTGFWKEARTRYSLTSQESKALQDMVAEAGALRGMDPTDFLSQVFQPGILNGTEGIIGSLDKPLGILRRGKGMTAKQLEGKGRDEFAAHFDDLQSRVWAAEKPSDPKTWTRAQKAAYKAGDYKKFSKLRGYTDDEIADYEEYQRLMGSIDADKLTSITDEIVPGSAGVYGKDLFDLAAKVEKLPGPVVGKRGRSALEGVEGVSTRDDLVRQLSAVFSAHLDPSAKRALLMEFKPELLKLIDNGEVRLNLNTLDKLWDADAETQLADRIIRYMDGVPGTGAHDVLDDATRGSAAVRSVADRYLERQGITPLGERRHYKVDSPEGQAHYQKAADEFTAMPEVEYERTGRRPTSKQVHTSDTELKPQPAGMDDRAYAAYKQFVHENRAQYDHMVAPKSKGGLGIKVIVAKGDPYTADAAGRAAMAKDIEHGQLRVMGQNSDHPVMTNEQNVMFRAVHDVFGHAAEGFEFGPRGELNAAAAHFKMYSADARGALLSETHGQTAYVNFSNEVYNPLVGTGVPMHQMQPPRLDEADPITAFEALWGDTRLPAGQADERIRLEDILNDPNMPADIKDELRKSALPDGTGRVGVGNMKGDQEGKLFYTKFVGEGIRALPADQQHAILQTVSDLFHEFPDLRIHHIDIADLSGGDLVRQVGQVNKFEKYGLGNATGVAFGSDNEEAIILMSSKMFGDNYSGEWQQYANANESFRSRRYRIDPADSNKVIDRMSEQGVMHNAGSELEDVLRHEVGHTLDLMLRPRRVNGIHRRLAGHEDYYDTVEKLSQSQWRRKLSEYGMTDSKEFAAELFSFATNPKLDLSVLDPKLRVFVEEYQDVLRRGGYWKPKFVPDAEQMANVGKTVRELNAAKRGTVYAPQKAGIMSQETIDEFAQMFVGQGKHVESSPDVARVAQEFGKFSTNAVFNGLMKGDRSIHGNLLQDLGGIPTHSASPYNFTEGMSYQLATEAMKRKFDDAFRLQYFSQDRTMLERSVNHPMFGMYPASYMWGKLAPEMVQFIAQRPFGMRTGGMAYGMMDAQAAIALRREYDPEFDAQIEKMGHSQALSFLGFMMPAVPWDISASAPTWMKTVAQQGQRNDRNVAAGKPVENFNATKPITDVWDKLNPVTQNVGRIGQAIDDMNGVNTPAEQRSALAAEATKGANLSPMLEAVLAELQDTLRR